MNKQYQHSTNLTGEAWVGFRDNCGLAWLRILKPGFRHCFLLLRAKNSWLLFDPLSHYTCLDLVPCGDELLDVLSREGCLLMPVKFDSAPERRALPWRLFSCVEAVKRVLGLRAATVLTPWQLFRHLQVRHVKKSSY